MVRLMVDAVRRSWLVVLAAAVCLVAALSVAMRPRAGRPDVLVITIDTLRADAAGRGKGTPAIEEFLGGAALFSGARTPVPLTLPAHLSLLTGRLPAAHGVHDNAQAVPPSLPLLTEELRAAGYATAAFVASSILDARTGIARGFDVFVGPPPVKEAA
ncbi:MAG: sulfatase-like hydrolase/transferase, partial [Planctomycetota bacterium]